MREGETPPIATHGIYNDFNYNCNDLTTTTAGIKTNTAIVTALNTSNTTIHAALFDVALAPVAGPGGVALTDKVARPAPQR